MENMVNNIDRTPYRCRTIIKEIDSFISENDKGQFAETRKHWYWNYMLHLCRLYDSNQIMIERNNKGEIINICCWALVNKEDEKYINKVTWELPKEISKGNNLYISICIIKEGNIFEFRREFVKLFRDRVDEAFWFDINKNKFIRRKNILKEISHATSSI